VAKKAAESDTSKLTSINSGDITILPQQNHISLP